MKPTLARELALDALLMALYWRRPTQSVIVHSDQGPQFRKHVYKTRDLARADVFDYIEVFYHQTHRHSHLGGVNPEAFEQAAV